jgi:hypothetical protein
MADAMFLIPASWKAGLRAAWVAPRPMWGRTFLLLGFLAWATGCVTEKPDRSSRRPLVVQPAVVREPEAIREVNLMVSPVGVNLDEDPRLDGIALRLFFSAQGEPKPVALRGGVVEILLFDGLFVPGREAPPLLRTWTYAAQQLKTFQYESVLGVGYDLSLAWGTAEPTSRAVSVVAKYNTGGERYLLSKPGSVSVMNWNPGR